MRALRRVLLVLAVLAAVGGFAMLLRPYDTAFAAPVIAGQADLVVDVPCKAPLVDFVTDEPDDSWFNYAPNRGVVYESDDRAGGAVCASTMQTRGTVGFTLLLGALIVGGVAVALGRRPTDAVEGEPPADGTGARSEPSD